MNLSTLLLLGWLLPQQMNPASDNAGYRLAGPLTQGAVLFGQTEVGASVMLDGEVVPVGPQGQFLLGFGRDAAAKAVLEVTLPDGKRSRQTLAIARRDYAIERIDGLPPAKVTPPDSVRQRIADDNAQVRTARALRELRDDFSDGFIWPAEGRISGVYGSQRILNGQPRRPHYGIDIAAPTGSPVLAPAAGTVTLAHPDMYYSGGTLIVDHGHGLSSTFLHLDQIDVEVGQRVEQGEVIATIGATGRVTGPHLDWRMNWGKERVDPELLVPCRPRRARPCESKP
ncbi:MAG: M23 family metallopeptidase [Pseudomonadota bacterium]